MSEHEYETVVVPEDSEHYESLSDGDVLENLLIDISAPGATFRIGATVGSFTIRNIGIKGVWDQYEKSEPFIVQVEDPNGEGLIENFYFADGCPDDDYPGVTGIYVGQGHRGTLTIRNVNIQDLPDNAIYASTMGHPDNGGGGIVQIEDSYAEDCQAAHFRIGTTGSYVKNCVAIGGESGDRGMLGRFEDTECIDCDFSGHDFQDVGCGSFGWPDSTNATVTVTNTRFEKLNQSQFTYTGEIIGESAGPVQRTSPEDVEGVPLSAEMAASGGGSSGTPDPEPTGDILQIIADSDTIVNYELTADGEISTYEVSDTVSSVNESNVTVTDNGDGTYTATGTTGNTYGDAFEIGGDITSFTADTDGYSLLLNDETVSADEFGPTNEPPTAHIDVEPDGLTVDVSADASDPDGEIVSYEWDFDDGATDTGPTASHTYADSGTYTITLTVTDDAGATTTAEKTLTVAPLNQGPIASFNVTSDGLTATFDASPSYDPDDTIMSYEWEYGDGEIATGETAEHTYESEGSYDVTLTVEDSFGATATSQKTITVATDSDPVNEEPPAEAGILAQLFKDHPVIVGVALAGGVYIILKDNGEVEVIGE